MDLSLALAALDTVVLERVTDGRFERRSGAPRWWQACTDQDSREPLLISSMFPFLEAFLPDAERTWSSPDSAPIASELWTETDSTGQEIHLGATATRVAGAAVLVIARNDQAFAERQLLLQRARELRLTYDALMREIERKDVLLHTIIHDLAAPLHSVVGSLSLLREIELPATAVRWTEIAVEAAARQRELIQGILSVFVAEHGTPEPGEPCCIELGAAIRRAVSEREPVARQRQVELVHESQHSFQVAAEETRLIRVLTNLLDNAIRHTPAGKPVRITAAGEDGWVRITVDDEGPGVAPDMVTRLFQKLAREPREGGSGLGLYFCRITVEQWGGGIGYEPRPGGGSRFWLRIPVATGPRDKEAADG